MSTAVLPPSWWWVANTWTYLTAEETPLPAAPTVPAGTVERVRQRLLAASVACRDRGTFYINVTPAHHMVQLAPVLTASLGTPRRVIPSWEHSYHGVPDAFYFPRTAQAPSVLLYTYHTVVLDSGYNEREGLEFTWGTEWQR